MKRKSQQAQQELTKSQKRRKKEFKVAPHVFKVLSSLVPTMLSDPGIEDCALDAILLEKGTQDRLEESLTKKQRKELTHKIYRGEAEIIAIRLRDYLRDIACPRKKNECHGLMDVDANFQIHAWQAARKRGSRFLIIYFKLIVKRSSKLLQLAANTEDTCHPIATLACMMILRRSPIADCHLCRHVESSKQNVQLVSPPPPQLPLVPIQPPQMVPPVKKWPPPFQPGVNSNSRFWDENQTLNRPKSTSFLY